MTFLPIVERELRVRSRRKSTFRIRMVGALAASLFAGALMLFSDTFVRTNQVGMFIFSVLTFLAFVFCLTEGARTTADCLSSEKREGTLGLLFLTDLKSYDVVLGKLMASSLNSIYVLLAIFPALAVPLTLGGVTGGEFWRVLLVLLHTLLLSLALGMLVSSLVRDERVAWTCTMGMMLAMTVLPIIPPFSLASDALPLVISPATALESAYDSSFQNQSDTFWWGLGSLLTFIVACLGSASLLLPNRWQDAPRIPKPKPLPLLSTKPNLDSAQSDQESLKRRRLQLDSNPIVWLASMGKKQSRALWFMILVACGGAIVLTVGTGAHLFLGWTLFLSAVLLHLILSLWIALQACHALAESRASGALEMLLCTPLKDQEIVTGHWMALKRLFFRPAMTLAIVEITILSAIIVRLGLDGEEFKTCLLLFLFFGGFLFTGFLDMLAVGRFGLWMGLKWMKPNQALTRTILYVLAIPMVFACCYFIWPLVGTIKNVVFINYGSDQLRRKFRFMATQTTGNREKGQIMTHHTIRPPDNPLPPVIKV